MLQSDPDSPVAMNKPGAPLFNKFLFLLVPAILLGTFGRPLLRPVLPILEQNWWASTIKPGHTCNNAPHSDIICKDALNKSNMANTVSASVAACLSIFLFPVMGKLSDTYGRRPLIVASSVMATVHPITLFLIDKNLLSFYLYAVFFSWRNYYYFLNLICNIFYSAQLLRRQPRLGSSAWQRRIFGLYR
jgi:MFS family permease